LPLIRDRQRLNQADLVDQHQPILTGDLHAERERRADGHQEPEQHEGDEDHRQGEDRPDLLAPDVLPDERKVFHAAASSSTPLSR
jgi:hypothetical protein